MSKPSNNAPVGKETKRTTSSGESKMDTGSEKKGATSRKRQLDDSKTSTKTPTEESQGSKRQKTSDSSSSSSKDSEKSMKDDAKKNKEQSALPNATNVQRCLALYIVCEWHNRTKITAPSSRLTGIDVWFLTALNFNGFLCAHGHFVLAQAVSNTNWKKMYDSAIRQMIIMEPETGAVLDATWEEWINKKGDGGYGRVDQKGLVTRMVDKLIVSYTTGAPLQSTETVYQDIKQFAETALFAMWAVCLQKPRLPLIWCWAVQCGHPEIGCLHRIFTALSVRKKQDVEAWNHWQVGAAKSLHAVLVVINWDFTNRKFNTHGIPVALRIGMPPELLEADVPVLYANADAAAVKLNVEKQRIATSATSQRRSQILFAQSLLRITLTGLLSYFESMWAAVQDQCIALRSMESIRKVLEVHLQMAPTSSAVHMIQTYYMAFTKDAKEIVKSDPLPERMREADKARVAWCANLKTRTPELLSLEQKLPEGLLKFANPEHKDAGRLTFIQWDGNYINRKPGLKLHPVWQKWCSVVTTLTGKTGYLFQGRQFVTNQTRTVELGLHILDPSQRIEKMMFMAPLETPDQIYVRNSAGHALVWSQTLSVEPEYLMTFFLPSIANDNAVGVHMTPTSLDVLLRLQYMSIGAIDKKPHTLSMYNFDPVAAQSEMWMLLSNGSMDRVDFRVAEFLRSQSVLFKKLGPGPSIVLSRSNGNLNGLTTSILDAKMEISDEHKKEIQAFAHKLALSLTGIDKSDAPPSMPTHLAPYFTGFASIMNALTSSAMISARRKQRDVFMAAEWQKAPEDLADASVSELYKYVRAIEEEEEKKLMAAAPVLSAVQQCKARIADYQKRQKKIAEKLAAAERDLATNTAAFDKGNQQLLKLKQDLAKKTTDAEQQELKAMIQNQHDSISRLSQQKEQSEAQAKHLTQASGRVSARLAAELKLLPKLELDEFEESDPRRQELEAAKDDLRNTGFLKDSRLADHERAEMNEMDPNADEGSLLSNVLAANAGLGMSGPQRYTTYDISISQTGPGQLQIMTSRDVARSAVNEIAKFFGETSNPTWKEFKMKNYALAFDHKQSTMDAGAVLRFEKFQTRLVDMGILCRYNFARPLPGGEGKFSEPVFKIFENLQHAPQEGTIYYLLGHAIKHHTEADLLDFAMRETVPRKEALEEKIDQLVREHKEAVADALAIEDTKEIDNLPVSKWQANVFEFVIEVCKPKLDTSNEKISKAEAEQFEEDVAKEREKLRKELPELCKGETEDESQLRCTLVWLYGLHVHTARRASSDKGGRYTAKAAFMRNGILHHIALADRVLRLNNGFLLNATRSRSLRMLFSTHVAEVLRECGGNICPERLSLPGVNIDELKDREVIKGYILYKNSERLRKMPALIFDEKFHLSVWNGDDNAEKTREADVYTELKANAMTDDGGGEGMQLSNDEEEEEDMTEADKARRIIQNARLAATGKIASESRGPFKGPNFGPWNYALYGSYTPIDGLHRPSSLFVLNMARELKERFKLPQQIRDPFVPDWSINDVHFLENSPRATIFWLRPLAVLRDLDDIIWRQISLIAAATYSVHIEEIFQAVIAPAKMGNFERVFRGIYEHRSLVTYVTDLIAKRERLIAGLRAQHNDLTALLKHTAPLEREILEATLTELDVMKWRPTKTVRTKQQDEKEKEKRAGAIKLVDELKEGVSALIVQVATDAAERAYRIPMIMPPERMHLYAPESPGYIALHLPNDELMRTRDALRADPGAFPSYSQKIKDKLVDCDKLPMEIIADQVLYFYTLRAAKLRRQYRKLADYTIHRSEEEWKLNSGDCKVALRTVQDELAIPADALAESNAELSETTKELTVQLDSLREDDTEGYLDPKLEKDVLKIKPERDYDELVAEVTLEETKKKRLLVDLDDDDDYDDTTTMDLKSDSKDTSPGEGKEEKGSGKEEKVSVKEEKSGKDEKEPITVDLTESPPSPNAKDANSNDKMDTSGRYSADLDELSRDMAAKLIFRNA